MQEKVHDAVVTVEDESQSRLLNLDESEQPLPDNVGWHTHTLLPFLMINLG